MCRPQVVEALEGSGRKGTEQGLEILLCLPGCEEVSVSLDALVRDVVDRVIKTVDQTGCKTMFLICESILLYIS